MKHSMILALCAAFVSTAALAQPVAITGGVGEKNREVIKEYQEEYNLKLIYTGEEGIYLSDVQVVIRDAKGNEVIKGPTQGPFLLAQLPAGTYRVESETEGYRQQQTIKVTDKLKTHYVRFPIKDMQKDAAAKTLPSEPANVYRMDVINKEVR